MDYKAYQKIHAATYILSFPMEVSTRLSSCNCIKQETVTFGFFVWSDTEADGINRHGLRVASYLTYDSAWLQMIIDAKSK